MQAKLQKGVQAVLAISNNLGLDKGAEFLALAFLTDRAFPFLKKAGINLKDPPPSPEAISCACILAAARVRIGGDTSIGVDAVVDAAEKVLPISAVCTRQDIQQAELWLASAIDLQSDQPRLASDSLQEVASQLQQTGVPAFLHEELPQLCDAILEALHSSSAFYGCLTQGGTLLGVAVLGAAMLLTSKPKHDAWPGVLALLSDVSGHPKVVIAAQIETILTSVLS